MRSARILYVEDEEDIRETMTMLLAHEGFAVDAVPTAELALEALGAVRYDLLLTDYRLPSRSAAWLLETATERGVLGDTPVIVLTGDDRPEGVERYRVLRKPVSQEALFAAFEEVLPPIDTAPAAPASPELRLVLYVADGSQASRKARRNLARILEGVDPGVVEIVVHDLTDAARVDAAERDRIVVLPTLVRVEPYPRVWVAGDLSDIDVVRDAIVPSSLRPD